MNADFLLAIGLALAMTGLIAVIEITTGAKTHHLKLICRSAFVIYLFISVVGTTATTLVAAAAGRNLLAPPEPKPAPAATRPDTPSAANEPLVAAKYPWFVYSFLYAFAGVFAFKALLQQINITFANQGVLTIEEWISKARETAVAATVEAKTNAQLARRVSLARKIDASTSIGDTQLNTYVDQWLGAGKAAGFNQQAAVSGGNARLLKALALASEAYDLAATLI